MKSNSDIEKYARPFLKWAGGKGGSLVQLAQHYPPRLSSGKCKRYIEPFLGGGAVFFDIFNNFDVSDFILIDVNPELILVYDAVKNFPCDLICELRKLDEVYNSPSGKPMRPAIYNQCRDEYNARPENDIRRAALMVFLNRTCFNGLYRVNSAGIFNVPIGRYENPCICDADNIMSVSRALRCAEIICADFSAVGKYIDKSSFVYYDPPYRPVKKTSAFNFYYSKPFDDDEQRRLKDFFAKMDSRGAMQMLSNSDPMNYADDLFFDELYKDFNISRISAKRLINSKVAGRGEISELLITNY